VVRGFFQCLTVLTLRFACLGVSSASWQSPPQLRIVFRAAFSRPLTPPPDSPLRSFRTTPGSSGAFEGPALALTFLYAADQGGSFSHSMLFRAVVSRQKLGSIILLRMAAKTVWQCFALFPPQPPTKPHTPNRVPPLPHCHPP